MISVDENLVNWMLDFMMDRWVHRVVDGTEGHELLVNSGLPQGSLASPILFAIYMHDLHDYVESGIPEAVSFSFVDDFTWQCTNPSVRTLALSFHRVSHSCMAWAAANAVRFEWSKTEAIIFSKDYRIYWEVWRSYWHPYLHFHLFKNNEQSNNKLRPKSDPLASQISREDGSSLQSRRRPVADATTPGQCRKPRTRSDLQLRWRWSRTGRKHRDGLHRGVQKESQSRPRGCRAS
jgi:hypothetical protein